MLVLWTLKKQKKHKPTVPSDENDIGLKRIKELEFELSTTQLKTPRDGNCMFHCVSDQSDFQSHLDVRNTVV